MKSVALLLLCLLVLSPGCSSASPESAQRAEAATTPPPVSVDVAKVEARDLPRSVEAVGTLDPNEEVTISNQVEGTVETLFVDFGDAVRAGQVVAQLDTRELELNVHQQEAALQQELARLGLADANASFDEAATSQVRQAEATFNDAKIRLDRTRKLAESGVIAREQLDAQQAQYDIAEAAARSSRENVRNIRASVAARKAALALAQKKLADAKITAPIAGLVKDRSVSVGQFLKANGPVVTIVQINPLRLHAEVPESAVAYVRGGRAVEFHVDAFPERSFEGKITRLSPAVDQESRTLKLEAIVSNTDGVLRPGFFARVTIHTDRKDKVLIVPAGSLNTVSGIEKVYVVDNGRIAERIVRSGAHLGEEVEIVEGLKEGEMVAKSNLAVLQQGREVAVR